MTKFALFSGTITKTLLLLACRRNCTWNYLQSGARRTGFLVPAASLGHALQWLKENGLIEPDQVSGEEAFRFPNCIRFAVKRRLLAAYQRILSRPSLTRADRIVAINALVTALCSRGVWPRTRVKRTKAQTNGALNFVFVGSRDETTLL